LPLGDLALEGREPLYTRVPHAQVAQQDASLGRRAVDEAVAEAQAESEVDEHVASLGLACGLLEAERADRGDGGDTWTAGRELRRSGLPPSANAASSPRSTPAVGMPWHVAGIGTSSSQQPPARSSM